MNKKELLGATFEEENQKDKVMLKDIPVGGKFDTGIGRFIVLDQKGDCTAVITEGLYHNQELRMGIIIPTPVNYSGKNYKNYSETDKD